MGAVCASFLCHPRSGPKAGRSWSHLKGRKCAWSGRQEGLVCGFGRGFETFSPQAVPKGWGEHRVGGSVLLCVNFDGLSVHPACLLPAQIVNLIEETGHFNVTNTTFDFDLFSLDETTVRKLQSYLEAVATWRLASQAGCCPTQRSPWLVPGNEPTELGLLFLLLHPKHCLREQPCSMNAQPAALSCRLQTSARIAESVLPGFAVALGRWSRAEQETCCT